MQKWYPTSDQNGLQKGPNSEPKSPKWVPKAIPKWGSKKQQKMMIFSTLECGSCIVNNNKIDEIQVLVLAPFWVSFWRCFGSPNGGQGHQKATSKKHQKNDAQNDPKLVPKGSQNGAKIIKNEVLEAPCFKGGSQVASRPPPGSILERFWDHFGTIFVSFSNIFLMIFACIL